MQTLYRADRLGDRLLDEGAQLRKKGERVKEMLSDGRISEDEVAELDDLAQELFMQSDEVSEAGIEAMRVAADCKAASQLLRLGREHSPNRHLRDLNDDLARMSGDIKKGSQVVTDFEPGNEAA